MPGSAPGSAARVQAVVTHHRDGFRSGVARFNELLADRLGVPLLGLDEDVAGRDRSLLSFKVGEMTEAEREALSARRSRTDWHGEVYLHDWAGLPARARDRRAREPRPLRATSRSRRRSSR